MNAKRFCPRRSRRRSFLRLAVAGLFLALGLPVAGQSLWHEHAARAYAGGVDHLLTVEGQDAFSDFNLDAGWDGGMAWVVNSDPRLEWELAGFRRTASGRQRAALTDASGTPVRAVRCTLDRLCLFARRRFGAGQRFWVPWVGLGAGLGSVQVRSHTLLETPHGWVEGAGDHRTSVVFSAEVGAGVDLYFSATSAWALTAEARHVIAFEVGPFAGDLTSTGVFVGLRWDFWPNSD